MSASHWVETAYRCEKSGNRDVAELAQSGLLYRNQRFTGRETASRFDSDGQPWATIPHR